MADRLFCSVASLDEGEPLPGLGHPSARTLLWRVPKARWQDLRRAVQKSEGEVALAIRAAAKAGGRVVFVSRAAPLAPPPALVSLPEGIAVEEEDEARVEAMVLAWCRGEALAGLPDNRIAILCCTDGRTDPCCARNGMATYRALAAIADPAVFDLVESSHLGGCRFATTLLVVPAGRAHGERYGRLTPDQAPAFLAAVADGRPYLPALRGLGMEPEADQVAKVGGLAWAAGHGLPARDVIVLGARPSTADPVAERSIAMSVDGVKVTADLARRSFRLLDDCAAHGAALDGGHDRWVIERIRTAD